MFARYGVDVLDRRVSLRRVHVLLQRLPAGYWSEGELSWSVESHLLATVIDGLSALTYVTLKANGAKSAKQPKPVPRPTPKPRPRTYHVRDTEPKAAAADASARTSWSGLAQLLMGQKGVEVRTIRG